MITTSWFSEVTCASKSTMGAPSSTAQPYAGSESWSETYRAVVGWRYTAVGDGIGGSGCCGSRSPQQEGGHRQGDRDHQAGDDLRHSSLSLLCSGSWQTAQGM